MSEQLIVQLQSYVDQIIILIHSVLIQIQDFIFPYLQNITIDSSWIIVAYGFVVIVLILIDQGVVKSHIKVVKQFVEKIDEIFYLQAKILYFHHDQLHDSEHNLPLLTHGKQELFKSSKQDYVHHYEALKKDIQYCEEIFQQKLVEDSTRDQL